MRVCVCECVIIVVCDYNDYVIIAVCDYNDYTIIVCSLNMLCVSYRVCVCVIIICDYRNCVITMKV